MAKPRVFVSSTYYDLKHAREHLESFVEGMGYEPVLFESGDIPFRHDQELDKSCYAEIQRCHMLVLIIGGRYGSRASDQEPPSAEEIHRADDFFDSITKKEYLTARSQGSPLFIFVQRDVLAEHRTYKRNSNNDTIHWASVDSVNVFRFIDEILRQDVNNFVRAFDRLDDITTWLRDQWAGLLTDMLSQKSERQRLTSLEQQVAQMAELNRTFERYLKTLLEAMPDEKGKEVVQQEEQRLRDADIDRRLAENPVASHYIQIHEVPYEVVKQAFGASDFAEFVDRVEAGAPAARRKAVREEIIRYFNEFSSFREDAASGRRVLGLPPWPDPKQSQQPHLSSPGNGAKRATPKVDSTK